MGTFVNVSDTASSSFCHNCGDHVDDNTIYCESCQVGEKEISVDAASGNNTKSWDDVKDTTSGQLASLVHFIVVGSGLLSAILSVIAMISEYALGITGARPVLLVSVTVVFAGTGVILKKTWATFRLRIESLQ